MSEAAEARVKVELPANLCLLAKATREVEVGVRGVVTQRAVLDALEAAYPMLKGTVRDRTSKARRPFIRFFACEQDLSHRDMDEPLPDVVARGKEAFLIIGAIAGG
jgi:molybdopterin synthase sulfur carrier subunit